MRTALLALLLSSANLVAGTNFLKPADYAPLTGLPWKKPDATLEGTLGTIFREPNLEVRYPVLAEYLHTIPAGQLGKAFDICIDLEGTQRPDKLVYFFLKIWAQRDPRACWKRTEQLFHVVGIEGGWLYYTRWDEVITVQDLHAIRASRFWLSRAALKSFPLGVDGSPLPRKERIQIMREFVEKWFDAFGSWPGSDEINYPTGAGYFDYAPEMMRMFSVSTDQLRRDLSPPQYATPDDRAATAIKQRRLLEAAPDSGAEILKNLRALQSKYDPTHAYFSMPDMLLLWAKLDQAGMIRCADAYNPAKEKDNSIAVGARGFLMSRVDADTRARWLAQAKSEGTDENGYTTLDLIYAWIRWDPQAAIDAVVATGDYGMLSEVIQDVTRREFGFNSIRAETEVIRKFDVSTLPKQWQDDVPGEWDILMENWGEIDIGEDARYGVDTLLRVDQKQRAALLRNFSGEDVEEVQGDMPGRTLAALREWAVVRPDEMRDWIGTLKDAEMRKALTWLLDSSMGRGTGRGRLK